MKFIDLEIGDLFYYPSDMAYGSPPTIFIKLSFVYGDYLEDIDLWMEGKSLDLLNGSTYNEEVEKI